MKRLIVAMICALAFAATPAVAEGFYDEDGRYVYTDGGYVFYQAHVQNYGDLPPVYDGRLSGTTGESRRLEAVRIYGAPIESRVYVQGVGWTRWVMDEWVGTKGQAVPAEALQVRTTRGADDDLHVEYRVHVQCVGWMPWVSDGATAGLPGLGLRVEAIEVRLVNIKAGG
jgi:uncharacterized protein YjdB